MRRIASGVTYVAGRAPVKGVRWIDERDYRLLLRVVKQAEPLARLAAQGMVAGGMFVGLARALNALNKPKKQK